VPDRTKIVFSHGEEVAIHAQAREVRRRLSKGRKAGEAFTKLKTDHDAAVYVAAGQVAYIEQLPEGLMGTPIFTKKQSRKLSLLRYAAPFPEPSSSPQRSSTRRRALATAGGRIKGGETCSSEMIRGR
jgi:hypothetical protein